MPIRRVENAQSRCHDAVESIAKLTAERNALLESVSKVVDGSQDDLEAHVELIEQVKYTQLLRMHEQAATIARSVHDSARVSENASRQVKALDALLARVQAAQKIADALLAQQQNVRLVATALERGDIEQAVSCVTSYRRAKAAVAGTSVEDEGLAAAAVPIGGSSASNDLGSSSPQQPSSDSMSDVVIVDRDELMSGATTDLQTRIETLLSSAINRSDKANVMKYSAMLADLGLVNESTASYRAFVCDATTKQLDAMIEKALRAMEQSPSASQSHLAVVSNGLDMIVATFEQEESFVLATFGKQETGQLLLDLHSKCTSHCVRVLQDFLKRRKISQSSSSGGGGGNNSASPESSQRRRGGASSSSQEEPRVLDQRLEDIAHLVSCCHLYLRFMEDRYREAMEPSSSNALTSTAGDNSSSNNKASAAAIMQDNALADMVQELLSIYIPMQSEYLEAAFNQALKIQQSAQNSKTAGGGDGAANSSSTTAGGGFIDVLASLYQTGGSGEGGSGMLDSTAGGDYPLGAAHWEYLRNDVVEIGLVDDVFYFLRVGLHRAIGTKNSSIISSVMISVGELIQDRLIKELERYATSWSRTREASAHSIPPLALKWLCAAQRAAAYTKRLGEEVLALTAPGNGFSPADTVRFSEQKLDLDVVADTIAKSTAGWITKFAAVAAASMATRFERFVAAPYHNMTEEAFLQSEMTDLWAAAAVAHWGHALDYYQAFLDEDSYVRFLSELLSKLARQLEEAVGKKTYNSFGALQLDKDIRTVKSFFVERADCPVREKFARLTAIVSLLMLDSLADAQAEPPSDVLSVEERRRVLLLRADFSKDQVLSLKLQ